MLTIYHLGSCLANINYHLGSCSATGNVTYLSIYLPGSCLVTLSIYLAFFSVAVSLTLTIYHHGSRLANGIALSRSLSLYVNEALCDLFT